MEQVKTAKYRNSWYDPEHPIGPEFYETEVKPVSHAGYLIYQRIHGLVWDVVKDGTCVAQRAGLRGAKEAAEKLEQCRN